MTMNSDQTSTFTTLCTRCNVSIEEKTIVPIPIHALRSDYIPTEAEITHARALIEKEDKLLKEYDKEVAWHREIVEKLEKDRKAVEERLEKRRASISGLRRLPVEVMDEIFSLACQTIRVGESEQWDTRNLYPFDIRYDEPIRAIAHNLSLTCASWRRIVTSRPRLWSTISFDIYHRSRETDIRPLLRTYLKYSSTAPLQISIWDARRKRGSKFRSVVTYYGGLDTKTVAAYRMILQQMHRCAKAGAQGQLGGLDTIHSDHNAQSGWFWKSIRMAPNLAYVHEGASNPSHVDDLPFNHQTLTTLHLGGVDGFPKLLHTLVNNSKLETFSLRALYPTWHWVDRPDQTQILPLLRNLKVYCGYPLEQWLYFFGFITMPTLESLWIGGSEVAELEGLLYHQSPAFLQNQLHATSIWELLAIIDATIRSRIVPRGRE
ncbi:hypothetical protein VNI00_013423 [Paramarasmius palmivorus]|uniref:F-box domain-containing protein n=1 Tax=Paramarasmius palmivorus TaxID=297713 RepID=A0AAW0BY85_9AGAR